MNRLRVENLRKNFGGLAAVDDVTLGVEPGARVAIIGPNGAGKSTLFNLIAGELKPSAGRVFWNDRDITALPTHARANLGLGHTFQRNNLFLGLTTLENVRLALHHRHSVARNVFTRVEHFTDINREGEALLARVGLAATRNQRVSVLAHGEQRALEVALALATEPQALLLDEPTAGMSPAETAEMVRLIQALSRTLTLMIVEHDMDVVFTLAERIIALHYGQVIADGAPEEIRRNPKVVEIYLGQG